MPMVMPVTEMQRNSSSLTDTAMNTKEPIYLTRHGKSAVVLIDAEEFDRRMRYRDAIVGREEAIYAGVMKSVQEIERGEFVDLDTALSDLEAKWNQ